jgi:hypothetical protein
LHIFHSALIHACVLQRFELHLMPGMDVHPQALLSCAPTETC